MRRSILQIGPRARRFGLADAPLQAQRAALGQQFTAGGAEVRTQHVGQALGRGRGAPLRHQPAFMPDRKTHLGPRQRVAAHGFQQV